MQILNYGFDVKHPNHRLIKVNFLKNKGVNGGYDVFTKTDISLRGQQFFFNSELPPTEEDAKDYAIMHLKITVKI